MGVFSRLSDLLAANVHALLDRAEDPEKMIAQIVREMEDALARARRYAAAAIAAERHVARELAYHRAETERWQDRARRALAAGREDLARRALARKKEHEDLAKRLEPQLATARQTSDDVKAALRMLQARLAEARRRQAALLARHHAARARRELYDLAGTTLPDPAATQAGFDRLERRLLAFEDEVSGLAEITQAGSRLEGEVIELETERAVTRELEALKAELRGTDPV